MSSLYGCSKLETQDVKPVGSSTSNLKVTGSLQKKDPNDTTGTGQWKKFLKQVEEGKVKDRKGQYVSKSIWIDNDGNGARPTRPKLDATTLTLASLFALPSAPGANTNITSWNGPTPNLMAPVDPPSDGGGGGGGGGYVPNYSHFSSTEIVQPYNVSGANLKQATQANLTTGPIHTANVFYSTENPNGYVYDLKIVKGPNDRRPPFHDNPYYHNIPVDLNEGAGGSYIYVSFTRDPSHVEYNMQNGCDLGGNEKNFYGGLDLPVTGIDTQVNCCGGLFDKCKPQSRPLYCASDFYVNSDFMRVPDLNDGAGGSYIYAFQFRSNVDRPIEVGVVTGNNVNIQPPAGWIRVGSDLNNGAGGSYIFLCKKLR